MEHGEMIANFNTAPATGYAILWAWIGVCFLASAVLIILHELLYSKVVFGINLVENANRRAEDAENREIQLESKVEAQDIRISYLEGENETLRELARRKGFKMPDADDDEDTDFEYVAPPKTKIDEWREKKKREALRPRYTPEERAEMWGTDGDNDYSIEL